MVVLTTGGTIASAQDDETGLLRPGAVTGEQLMAIVGLTLNVQIEVLTIFQVPSSHMTFENLLKLKDKINVVLEDKEVRGVVVTHGTDTLEETAYFLDLTLNCEKPIVVTGAQRGPFETGSDVFINIRHAVLTAVSQQAMNMGVLVVFNEKIFPARYVKKVHTSNIAGFGAPRYGNIGIIDYDEVFIYQRPMRMDYYVVNEAPPDVDFIKLALGVDGKFIDYAIKSGTKGIILEGLGRGHVTPSAATHVEQAVKQGVKVVLTTSCIEGQVYPVYHFTGSVYDLMEKGVILGKDYDSKKARIKLAVLLAAQVEDIANKF